MTETNGRKDLKLTLAGAEYSLARIGMAVLADAAISIRKERMDCFYGALAHIQHMEKNASRLAAVAAFESVLRAVTVSDLECRLWMRSPPGQIVMFHRALKKGGHKELSLEQATDLYDELSYDQWQEVDAFMYDGFWDSLLPKRSLDEVAESEPAATAE